MTIKVPTKGTIQLSNKSLVPSTVVVKNTLPQAYLVNDVTATLTWLQKQPNDSVEVTFRTLSINLQSVHYRRNYDSVKNNFFVQQPFVFNRNTQSSLGTGIFNFGNINYSGSFGRNISFGNSQDAVFNSQLNLQINGFVGDSIQLSAAITDNNIPIQPDGTTAQLNEFDRIMLQFKKKDWAVNLGDIDIRQNQLYFLNFYKRLQGMSYEVTNRWSANSSSKTLVSTAIAKGKFNRQILPVQEGNQGPYRLQGANNEIYFVVLANTERVFIDGELMQRGEDQDYIINYNTAEITFTPKRMITKDKRIQVEFEYADRNYLNALFYVNNQTKLNSKWQLQAAYYSNGDVKSSPINQTLDVNQKQFLANIGDSIQNAFYPYEKIDSFSTTKILYAKVPNAILNTDSIYVYSTNKDSAKYTLNFADVGQGNGNYILLLNNVNGKVYQWVAPLNGVKQGRYEPAQYLIAPKKLQVMTIGATFQPWQNTQLQVDIASSNYDVNTYSLKDKENNKGLAYKFALQHQSTTNWGDKKLAIKALAGYEQVNASFTPVERLRNVEFGRDWGLNILNNAKVNEQLPSLLVEIKDNATNTFQYNATGYFRSDGYKGVRHALLHKQQWHGWQISNQFQFTSNNSSSFKGFFLRPTVQLNKQFSQWNNHEFLLSYALEHNEQKFNSTDSILPQSFAFETIAATLSSNKQKANKWQITYFTRSDKLPYQKALLQSDRSNNINMQLELLQNMHHQFRFNITYRSLIVNNNNISNLKPDKSLLGRAEYTINEWKGLLMGNALYEIGTGQEQKRDFSYIEVQQGRGQYTWIDYNGDGIQQLNEFELATFADQGKYVRIFTATNQFVKANYTQFNYSLLINPKMLHNQLHTKWIKYIVTAIQIQSSLQSGRKVLADGALKFNPFMSNIADTSLISVQTNMRNTLSVNRFHSKWGIDISNINNANKSLLTYGFESRQLNEWAIKSRINFQKQYTIEWLQKFTSNSLLTPAYSNRNYQIKAYLAEPRITYTYNSFYRLQVGYQFIRKQNAIDYGGENAQIQSLIAEGKVNAVQRTSVLAKFTYSNISFSGVKNSTIGYMMLDGLNVGKNYLWNLELTKRFVNNLEMTISYEGRKPGDAKMVHIGRAGLRALL